jgi:hypothetical protein
MDNYDIIHVDDDLFTRRLVEFTAQKMGMTYKPAETLHDLKETMENSRARFYVVDGNFPRGGVGCNGDGHMLAPEAVDHIRGYCGNPVIVYSGHDSLETMGMEGYDVAHVMKGGDVKKLFDAMGD